MNNKVYNSVKKDIQKRINPIPLNEVERNTKRLNAIYSRVEELENKPPQKYFYYKAQKKELRKEVMEWTIRGLVVALTSVIVAKLVNRKKPRDNTSNNLLND